MKEKIARLLLDHQCLQLSPSKPFTYASGLKGPIYCDNRKLLSFIDAREEVARCFKNVVEKNELKYDKIAGLATAGIPHATLLAHELKKPLVYIRSKPKAHGKGNQVEGDFKVGEKLLLVEDLVNQASSLEEAFQGLTRDGLKADACLSIVDYQMPAAEERLKKMNLTLFSLTDFSTIASVGRENNLLSDHEYELLLKWHNAPSEWEAG